MGLIGSANEMGKGFDWAVTKRLMGYVLKHRVHLYIALVGMVVSVLGNIVGAPLIGYAVDEGIKEDNYSLVVLMAVLYAVTQVLGFYGFRVQLYHMAHAGQSVIRELRDVLFERIQRFELDFFSRYETGRLIARVIGDVNVIRETITFAVVGVVRDFATIVGIIVTMLIIDPPLTLVAVGVVVILGVVANFWRIYARKAYLHVRETVADVNAELAENFNAVRVVQAFSREVYIMSAL